MSGSFEDRQAQIDALLEETRFDKIPVQNRLLGLAKIGMDKPEALTSVEVKQVCYALVTHYLQMGIT